MSVWRHIISVWIVYNKQPENVERRKSIRSNSQNRKSTEANEPKMVFPSFISFSNGKIVKRFKCRAVLLSAYGQLSIGLTAAIFQSWQQQRDDRVFMCQPIFLSIPHCHLTLSPALSLARCLPFSHTSLVRAHTDAKRSAHTNQIASTYRWSGGSGNTNGCILSHSSTQFVNVLSRSTILGSQRSSSMQAVNPYGCFVIRFRIFHHTFSIQQIFRRIPFVESCLMMSLY